MEIVAPIQGLGQLALTDPPQPIHPSQLAVTNLPVTTCHGTIQSRITKEREGQVNCSGPCHALDLNHLKLEVPTHLGVSCNSTWPSLELFRSWIISRWVFPWWVGSSKLSWRGKLAGVSGPGHVVLFFPIPS